MSSNEELNGIIFVKLVEFSYTIEPRESAYEIKVDVTSYRVLKKLAETYVK